MSKDNIELSIIPINDSTDEFQIISQDDENIPTTTGSIPKISYLICLVEFSERFSYYMISGCLTNMIQRKFPTNSITGAIKINPITSNETPGALNLGLSFASFTMQFLTFFANISPIISGYIADTYLGKFKSVYIGTIIGIIGHFTLVIASIPFVMQLPYVSYIIILLSVALIAISAGFIKSNILPLLLDQYEHKQSKPDFKNLSNGSKLKIDHKATLEKLSMSFYSFINWGCTLSLFGSFIERFFGFWVVYLSTALLFATLPILLNCLKPRILHHDHHKNITTNGNVYTIFYNHLKNHIFQTPIPLDTTFADIVVTKDDIDNFFNCVILFLFFIPFYLNDSSLISVQISLAATMSSPLNLPNDIYQAINPITIIILIPLLSNFIYPKLMKLNSLPKPRTKIIIGFTITSIGTLFGAIVQHSVYSNSKCSIDNVSNCETQSEVSLIIWICYLLMFALQAIGECFAATTCYELAYELSPIYLRGGILALFLSSVALSSVLGELLSYWAKDPYLVNLFLFIGMFGIISAIWFSIWSRKINGICN